MLKQLIFISATLFLFSNMSTAQNLLENGNFAEETSGWSVLLADKNEAIKAQIIEHGDSYKEYGLADNYIGTNFVEIDGKSAIQQTIEVEEGQDYTLVFAFAHRPDAGDKQLIAQINGEVVMTKTVKNSEEAGSFTYKYVSYTATSDEAKIGFRVVSLSGEESQGVLVTDILFSRSDEIDLSKYSDMKY